MSGTEHMDAVSRARRPAADTPAQGWRVGEVVSGLYEVLADLGRGGMGFVQRVRHIGWGIDLAVKHPMRGGIGTEIAATSFSRECETWVSLGLHPHVATCYYVRSIGGMPRIFAEYVSGGSLAEWIAGGRLYEGSREAALARVLDIAIQICWGIGHAHSEGVIHQDIKPHNVLMTPSGDAKVTDFGLAKAWASARQEARAEPGADPSVSFGGMTRRYCSPEQASRRPVSSSTDIWSWAVTVLEMFLGEAAWRKGTDAPAALAEQLGPRPRHRPKVPIPERVARLLGECFQGEPSNRPRTALALARSLHDVYRDVLHEEYGREAPRPGELLASSLNNRAVSLIDLGRLEDACALWEKALQMDPNHLETVYNRGLLDWRLGKATDTELLKELLRFCGDPRDACRANLLMANAELERGHSRAALGHLKQIKNVAAHKTEMNQLVSDARATLKVARGRIRKDAVPDSGIVYLNGRYAVAARQRAAVVVDATHRAKRRALGPHTADIAAAVVSADGQVLVSCDTTGRLYFWGVSTGRCQEILRPHDSPVALCLSPDGRILLSGSAAGSMTLWSVATRKPLREFQGHAGPIGAMAFLPGCEGFLSGSADGTVRLWETGASRSTHTFRGDFGPVTALAAGAEGGLALSASADGSIAVWDVQAKRHRGDLPGHKSKVTALCASPCGAFAVSGSASGTVRLWRLAEGRCLCSFDTPAGAVRSLWLGRDGWQALSGHASGDVYSWRTAASADFHVSKLVLSALVTSTDASADAALFGKRIREADAAWEGGDRLIALRSLREARALPGCARRSDVLRRWTRLYPHFAKLGLAGAWQTARLEHGAPVAGASFCGDGGALVSCGKDCAARLWQIDTGECTRALQGHSSPLTSAGAAPDGRFFYTAGEDRTVRLWDASTEESPVILTGHRDVVSSAVLSADGRILLSASWDMTMRLWRTADGECVNVIHADVGPVAAADISEDGRYVLSAHWDGTVALWEADTGTRVAALEGHTAGATAVSFGANRRWGVSGSRDHTVRLWHVSTRRCMRVLTGHAGPVSSVQMTSDNAFVLSGSQDGTAKLWDAASGECLWSFEGHSAPVTSVGFAPGARLALTASEDGSVVVVWALDWHLSDDPPAHSICP